MRLYAGSSSQFIQDSITNQIAEKLKLCFFRHYRYFPPESEIRSWRNSLRAVSQVLQFSEMNDHGVILEYQLPLTSKRLDCMVLGQDIEGKDNTVIIELKQWEKCERSDSENEVMTWLRGSIRDVLHPSVQVGQYQMYLQDTHTAFYEGDNPVGVSSCAYLHNYAYDKNDVIYDEKFNGVLSKFPVFTGDDVDKLKEFLVANLKKGNGLAVLQRVEKSKYRPSKKLMEHVSTIINNKSEYILLDEQKIVYDKVFAAVKHGYHNKNKTVFIVKGGPGTGKSVIAINLMADLLRSGYNAHYATGSKAFTETLRKIIGIRGQVQFKYFNSYMDAKNNEIDVLLCDEAHRIRITSNNRYTPQSKKSNLPQVEELTRASKVLVCFIDDNQTVRPDEIGSADYIREFALEKNYNVFEYELEAQFRCNGSDAFVNWINNTLGVKKTANVIWESNDKLFDFKIYGSPESLEEAIKAKIFDGYSGRMTAGFCWEWSNPDKDGKLINDVVIDEYKRPWNAKPDARRLERGIPKAPLWAYDPNGVNQIGCIYTIQGFEFDYVGVIFGPDLTYNFDTQNWEGNKEESHDSVVKRSQDKYVDLMKNTYRVLLSRGIKGCYVHFMDKGTERFFKSRME